MILREQKLYLNNSFKKIDKEKWPRAYYYDYFMNSMRCRFGMTANIDITNFLKAIKSNNLRFYPTITYAVSNIINKFEEFRAFIDKNGEIIIWDVLNVRYPMFNSKDETVTSIWLEYCENFKEFYDKALLDIEKYSGEKSMYAKPNFPPNFYDITSIPWVSFTDFRIDMYGTDGTWLMPFVAVGKFFEQDGRTLLPVHINVHHATCDGYHVGRFYNELQSLVNNTALWLKI